MSTEHSEKVTVRRPQTWFFSTRKYQGTCRLAKEPTMVSAVFFAGAADDLLTEYPDVIGIEKWFAKAVVDTTAEELAERACDKWGLNVTVKMKSHLHGPIEVTSFIDIHE